MTPHPRGIAFGIETATACFSHGSEAGGTAELRASGFEAAARYWFRALAGPFLPMPCPNAPGKVEATCHCLRCEEGRVFGSADHGRGVMFALRTGPLRTQPVAMLPHHPPNGRGLNDRLARQALASGQRLELHVAPGLATSEPSRVRAAAASLLVGLLLGGVGQRSRRGAGSFAVKGVEGDPALAAEAQKLSDAAELQGWATSLGNVLKTCRAVVLAGVHSPTQAALGCPPPFPMLVPGGTVDARIVALALRLNSESNARAEVMRKLQPHKNAAFGLPYMKAAQGEQQIKGKDKRHASPVWINVQPLGSGYVGVFTAMRSASMVKRWGDYGSWSKVDAMMNGLQGAPVPL